MLTTTTTTLAAATSLLLLATGALASASGGDLADELRRDLHMAESGGGLFARQDDGGFGATNLNSFTGSLGAPPVPITQGTDDTHPFEVSGQAESAFQDAINSACSDQHNACADAANGPQQGQISVNQCDDQMNACQSTLQAATQTAFLTQVSSNAEFDFFCEL
ncbi:hypothetical protein GGR56DRAFT_641853 [Xylariaceae sp. FL0804]|nr:hypothetical protein GGR56DRAFT_641853 [Xylariaceae sp. FL0804]